MNEDFVPFELAKKLNEKGFNEGCLLHYESTGGFYSNSIDTYDRPNQELDYSDFLKCFNEGNSIGLIDAPTIPQVLKWLREEKKLHIEVMFIRPLHNRVKYYITDTDGSRGDFMDVSDEHYETWEQATLAGIEYVLDNYI